MPALIAWWTQDVARLAPDADPGSVFAAGADLLRRWGEPHRRYHTTTHLVELFWALEEVEEGGELDAREGALGRVAAWVHDAVYAVPDPGDNESRSAALGVEVLQRIGFRDEDVAVVDALVRASERHELPVGGGLAAAFHDADLWVLAAPADRFDGYCQQVREEYAMVPDAAYRQGRSDILRPFLERDRIYATRLGHAAWEPRARANLERELTRLA